MRIILSSVILAAIYFGLRLIDLILPLKWPLDQMIAVVAYGQALSFSLVSF